MFDVQVGVQVCSYHSVRVEVRSWFSPTIGSRDPTGSLGFCSKCVYLLIHLSSPWLLVFVKKKKKPTKLFIAGFILLE